MLNLFPQPCAIRLFLRNPVLRVTLYAILLFTIIYSLFSIYPSSVWAALPGEPGCTYTGPGSNPNYPPAGTPCSSGDDWESPLSCGGRSMGCQACDWCQGRYSSDPEEEFVEAIETRDLTGEQNKEAFDLDTVKDGAIITIIALGGTKVESGGGSAYHREGGAIGALTGLITNLYSIQPSSSIEYLADVSQNLGLARPAFAQGFGWTAFSPVLDLWKKFRDISYLAFVLIFVMVGFMIMFRTKIDPQTVISVQSALPKIVVTLLLITFSYSITGMIIDLSQLVTKTAGNILVDGTFLGTGGVIGPDESLADLLSSDIFKLINPLRDVENLSARIESVGVGPTSLPALGSLTVRCVFIIAGFFIMLKIFFALIGPYIGIVLSVIFSPFQLLSYALPGSSGGISNWLKGLLANVMVFPVTFIMLCIAAIFKSSPNMSLCPPPPSPILGQGASWCTSSYPVVIPWSPVTIGNWGQVAGELISFGILFMIPQIPGVIKSIFAGKGVPAEAGAAVTGHLREAIAKVPVVGSFIKI